MLFSWKELVPAINFVIEVFRFLIWTIVLSLVCISFTLYTYTTVGTTLVTVLLYTSPAKQSSLANIIRVLYLGSLIYSSIIFHRSLCGRYNGTYHDRYEGNKYLQNPVRDQSSLYQYPSQQQQLGRLHQSRDIERPATVASAHIIYGQTMYPQTHSTNLSSS